METSLKSLIESKRARVGIIGLGYVGLPLADAFVQAGFTVVGFDVDARKIEALQASISYLKHLGDDLVPAMNRSGRFSATLDFARLSEVDAILICVPTPLGKHREPDLSFVENTAAAIAKSLRPGQLVVLESTTYPGTTRDVVLPRLAASGLALGSDFFVGYSPEREDPGRKDVRTHEIPKLVGGLDSQSGALACALYQAAFRQVVPVRSAEVAEAAKLLENIYRAVNIAMVNEMKILLTEMNIDIWEVIDAAATKPFGFQPFYPGPGLGGHCIPIDPFYLTWKAQEVGLSTRFIELAGEINHMMPDYVVRRVALALNERGKAIRGARLLVLGLAYKPDVDDVRESPSFEIIEKLQHLGGEVDYHDPHVPETHRMRSYDLKMRSIELTSENIRSYDALIIATNHRFYDWQMIVDHANLVIDTRGALRHIDVDETKVFPA